MKQDNRKRPGGRVRLQVQDSSAAQMAFPDTPARSDIAADAVIEGLAKFNKALLRYLPNTDQAPAESAGAATYAAQLPGILALGDKLNALQPSFLAIQRQADVDAAIKSATLSFDHESWVQQGAKALGVQEQGSSPEVITPELRPWRRTADGLPVADAVMLRLGDGAPVTRLDAQ